MANTGINSRLAALKAAGFDVKDYVKIVDSEGKESFAAIFDKDITTEDLPNIKEVLNAEVDDPYGIGDIESLGDFCDFSIKENEKLPFGEAYELGSFLSDADLNTINDKSEDEKAELLKVLEKEHENGYIECGLVHRRFITAHFLRHIFDKDDICAFMSGFSMKYVIGTLINELKTYEWSSVDKDRKRFFTPEVVIKTIEELLEQVYKAHKRCLKSESGDLFRLSGNIFRDSDSCESSLRYFYGEFNDRLNLCKEGPKDELISRLLDTLVLMSRDTRFKKIVCKLAEVKVSYEFKQAYMGAGAYYSMKNLIMFHGVRCGVYNMAKSLAELHYRLNKYTKDGMVEGWRFKAMLKKMLAENDFTKEKFIANCKKTYNK